MFDFSNFHVGLTNRCRLSCPACARTNIETKLSDKIFDMDPAVYRTALLRWNPKEILFCGNYGDPIYAAGFLELIKSLKENNPLMKIKISTNGTGKTTEWWRELMSYLNFNDVITFAVDGLPTNFMKYRVNAKWSDLENAVRACTSFIKPNGEERAFIKWKYIIFKYNENDIIQAWDLSKKLGVDGMFLKRAWYTDATIEFAPTRDLIDVKRELDEHIKNHTVL